MAEYDDDDSRSPIRRQSIVNSNDNTLIEDGNNSIIGKVKSRVSSILPNSLSKWFSPSNNNNNNNNNITSESINGNLSVNVPRRRRRILDEDDEDQEENIQLPQVPSNTNVQYQNFNDESNHSDAFRPDHGNSDDESNNSDDDVNISGENISPGSSTLPVIQVRRNQYMERVIQPPSKRCRLDTAEVTAPHIYLSHQERQPFVSSTPAYGNNSRSIHSSSPPNVSLRPSTSPSSHRYKKLYSSIKKEPAFNFNTPNRENNIDDIDIIDLIPLESATTSATNATEISNPRTLNIPIFGESPNTTPNTRFPFSCGNLKRQSLSINKNDTITSPSMLAPRRTSTTIHESIVEDSLISDNNLGHKNSPLYYNGKPIINNNLPTIYVPNKKRKMINGTGNIQTTVTSAVEENNLTNSIHGREHNIPETGSDSSECSGAESNDINENKSNQPKTGLFNMSSSSRQSSIGNGLNFYTHLEGRKSLFGGLFGGGQAFVPGSGVGGLNTSTLSLNALNRRQFNASIYGSTSALSDSRLLNTSSPFYKGKTTYGGAAAYNRYASGGIGGMNSALRITPTLMRPTSSLSNSSLSTNSLNGGNNIVGDNQQTALSSTAKRILELINDFATPLSDAKKMANNIKIVNQQTLTPQIRSRLNESDLQNARAMRLSQVRSPYMRPSITLKPKSTMNNSILPPVRELQVPSMSQLLQLKKMQNTTEASRQIALNQQPTQPINIDEHKASTEELKDLKDGTEKQEEKQQQAHVNKIKSTKMNAAGRMRTNAKDNLIEEFPIPVILPNIAFPVMQSIPKFDIALPTSSPVQTSSVPTSSTNSISTNMPKILTETTTKTTSVKVNVTNVQIIPAPEKLDTPLKTLINNNNASNSELKLTQTPPSSTMSLSKPNIVNSMFKFSEPLNQTNGDKQYSIPTSSIYSFKFSAPSITDEQSVCTNNQRMQLKTTPPIVPQLKTGSVLDALKKPFIVPPSSPSAVKPDISMSTTTLAGASSSPDQQSFGLQFKKSANEWECETCMIRNKQDLTKCSACETPRKSVVVISDPANILTTSESVSTSSSFGDKFKKSSNEWDCDICMIRNNVDANKCVACETPRKTISSTVAIVTTPVVANTFGDSFKSTGNTWECPTCMIRNKSEINACVACETKKPGGNISNKQGISSSTAPKMTFGFNAISSDSQFKSIATAQKASKWECEACMTQNDAVRSKCICCEQAKPGSNTVTDEVPKFSFGKTAAKKFTFGFAENKSKTESTNASTTSTSTTVTTTTATTTSPNNNNSNGFIFGLPNKDNAPTGGFSFGIKSAAPVTPVAPVKDNTSTGGFSFGIKSVTSVTPISSVAPDTTAVSTENKNSLVVKDKIETDGNKSNESKVLPTAAMFNFNPTSTSISSETTSSGFTFGKSGISTNLNTSTENSFKMPITSSTTTKSILTTGTTKSNTVSAPSQNTTVGFSFGMPNAPVVKAPTNASAELVFPKASAPTNSGLFAKPSDVNVNKETFNFGLTPTAITSSTTTVSSSDTSINVGNTATTAKPMFSFGNSSTLPTSSSSNSVATFGSPLSFGNISSGSKVKPLFGEGAVSSSTSLGTNRTTSTNSTSSTSTTPTASIFSQFGSNTSGVKAPIFGDVAKVNSSTVSTTPFGSGNQMASGNLFGPASTGTFGNISAESNKVANPAATTLFGNVSSSTSGSNNAFLFGNSNTTSTTTTTTGSTSNNTFLFGGTTGGNATTQTAVASTTSDQSNTPTFGIFGSYQNTENTAVSSLPQSIFGTVSTSAPAGSAFNTSATPNTNLFGNNSAPTVKLFGTSTVQSPAATPAPTLQFGSPSPFSGASATSTFGNASGISAAPMAAPSTFGGFGISTNVSNNADGASTAKKTEIGFNFGTANTQSLSTGGFNFGSGGAKPSFNFGTVTSTPSFNFTANSSEQTQNDIAKPFQFGATQTSTPVFNFSGGNTIAAAETTSNAPFQFNAGASPATTNIFAPTPMAGSGQAAQQARRKIRQPIRRLTPR